VGSEALFRANNAMVYKSSTVVDLYFRMELASKPSKMKIVLGDRVRGKVDDFI
jgi:hypothetical protein